MTEAQKEIPIQTLHLFPVLDRLLIELLQSLSSEEWQLPTIAKRWTVKDIAAHLLDGNLRTLSFSRDGHNLPPATNIDSYQGLVDYLNLLNAEWVTAARRLSPRVITELLQITGRSCTEHLQTLNPFDNAIFPVAWAGQVQSANWFHIAREYTEKFIHQQQIRDAVGRQALFTRELFFPFMHTFMFALPHTYRNTDAAAGTTVTVKILTDIGGEWSIVKTGTGWQFTNAEAPAPAATVSLSPDTAWKLFSKGITPEAAAGSAAITGSSELGAVALQLVAVMA